MRKASLTCLALAIVLCLTSFTQASLLQVGDSIGFFSRNGSAGEFGVTKDDINTLFVTFCVERNEFLNYLPNNHFNVDSIQLNAVAGGQGGGNPDPLGADAAWLYLQFWNGTLAGYDGSTAKADALQNAIWFFEGETPDGGWDQTYKTLADSTAAALKQAALNVVRVVNISWLTNNSGFTVGDPAQSVLIVTPEASTIAVWSVLSVVGLGAYRRRSRK